MQEVPAGLGFLARLNTAEIKQSKGYDQGRKLCPHQTWPSSASMPAAVRTSGSRSRRSGRNRLVRRGLMVRVCCFWGKRGPWRFGGHSQDDANLAGRGGEIPRGESHARHCSAVRCTYAISVPADRKETRKVAGYRDASECATVEPSCVGSRSSNTAAGLRVVGIVQQSFVISPKP